MHDQPTFRARGLTKRYGWLPGRGTTVLDQLDLELQAGRVTVLLGRNGAGKSTLMKLALGMLTPDAGELCVLGHDPLRRPDAVRLRVGYVPDVPDAPGSMRLQELCAFWAAHFPGRWNDDTARALADRFQIPSNRRLRRMSRGEGMKTMLLLALAPDPELLLLDEPFAGLDPIVRDEVLSAVVTALDDGTRRTVLCATHELDLAARLADDIAVLDGGRITRHGSLDEILSDGHRSETPQTIPIPDRLRAALAGDTTLEEASC